MTGHAILGFAKMPPGLRDASELKDTINCEVTQIHPVMLRATLLFLTPDVRCIVAWKIGHIEKFVIPIKSFFSFQSCVVISHL